MPKLRNAADFGGSKGTNAAAGTAAADLLTVSQAALYAYLMPTGAIAETFPRFSSANSAALTSGVLYVTAIPLTAGRVISTIHFPSGGTASSGQTHWWYGLYDSSLNQLAVTADQLTAAFAANADNPLAIATIAAGASASFTTTYSGLHYVGFAMVAGTTMPTLCRPVSSSINGTAAQAPILSGSSDTGITGGAPSFPHAAAAITKVNSLASNYAYVS